MTIDKRILLFIFIGFMPLFCLATALSMDGEAVGAFDYINRLRNQAGLSDYSKNNQLVDAASNHASYCHNNRVGGHYESREHPGYTGYDHIERINNAGYASRSTGENVSSHKGVTSDRESVDGLMSAIYHRFGFLSFDFDEIGIGKRQDETFNSFVYNMGNTHKNQLCLERSSNNPGKYYSSVCSDKLFRISGKKYDAATTKTRKLNPEIVIWPAADSSDVPPAFFEEKPDPLPNHGVSGYPVSIQFNPSAFSNSVPVVTRFQITDIRSEENLELIKRIDKKSDIYNKFTVYEHAIFPLKRLDWASQYRVEIDFMVDGDARSIEWVFETRDLDVRMYTVIDQQVVIKEKSDNPFAVYFPPRHSNDAELAYSTNYRGLTSLDIKIIDGNTLLINATGTGDAEIRFHGFSFKIEI